MLDAIKFKTDMTRGNKNSHKDMTLLGVNSLAPTSAKCQSTRLNLYLTSQYVYYIRVSYSLHMGIKEQTLSFLIMTT